ncbi:hypothetical protein BU14_0279s0003 [Porphyra umbilicalis]|uniref:Uncharacterized protein n=1 Tax=Porphyra umbilicalis TaxID=2786 RepID=A0A1X6P1B8_PORUM|nr:hypothetical protein BU14_0279s0003 [Porphyra umbilicalis]|eukprot:OSX74617.1 hypothetical protein BU14_0279s0003 [Porphyra umbilicalis]
MASSPGPPPPTSPSAPDDEGNNESTSSTASTASLDGLRPEDVDKGSRPFRRIDSDDVDPPAGRRVSVAGSAATDRTARDGRGGTDGDGGARTTGRWRRSSAAGDRRSSASRTDRREARLLASSRGRVRAALLARDPGGYKRALAEKHDLEAVFTGLAKLGEAVTSARGRGLADIAFVLDEERRDVRRALDAALSEADEDVALTGVAAAGKRMEEAFAIWEGFEAEERTAKASAHAALPWYARWADMDGDGEVSYREKRLWITLGLLGIITITCVVLVGLLTRDFVLDVRHPLTHARFEDVTVLEVPRLSFCVEGPAFSTALRGDRTFPGPDLFNVTYVQLPPGEDAKQPGKQEFKPIEEGLMRELENGPPDCSDAQGLLSATVTGITCVYCYELIAEQLELHRGVSVAENARHNVQVHFQSYAPFAQCMVAPTNTNDESVEDLRKLINTTTALAGLIDSLALTAAPTATSPITAAAVAAMSSEELCNTAFFSGYFYPTPAGEATPRYVWDGSAWTFDTSRIRFSSAITEHDPGVDVHVLDKLVVADNRAAHDHDSISGVPLGRVAANSLTQMLLSKRTIEHDIRRGADIQRVNEEQYAAKVEFYPRFEARQPGLQFFHLSLAFLSYTVEH